jgi:hypothetical protein
MFRSNWTILGERMLSLAKATILWNWSVKNIHRYTICGFVATSISGCDVCIACRVVWDIIKMHGTTIKKGIFSVYCFFNSIRTPQSGAHDHDGLQVWYGRKNKKLRGNLVKHCKYGAWYRKVLYLIPEGPYMNLGWDLYTSDTCAWRWLYGEKSRNV